MECIDCEPRDKAIKTGAQDSDAWLYTDFLSLRSLFRCCEPARIQTGPAHDRSRDDPPQEDIELADQPRHNKTTHASFRFLCEVDRTKASYDHRAQTPFAVGLKKSPDGEPMLLVANKPFEKLFGQVPDAGLPLRQLLGPATKAADRDRLLEGIRGEGRSEAGSMLLYGKSQQAGRKALPVEATIEVRSLKDTKGYRTYFGMRLKNVQVRDLFYVRYCQTSNEWLEHDLKYKLHKASMEDKVERTVGLASRMLMKHVRDDIKEKKERLAFDPYMQVDSAKDVQVKSQKGKRTVDIRGQLHLVKDVKHGVRGDGVLRRCGLESFGIKDTVASTTSMVNLDQKSQEWVAEHHELFNPIRERGSYSVEVVPGGLQVPVKMPEKYEPEGCLILF
ncbi:hypothetical protein GUITHDRAFT_100115 [Guillardia theta CCMP2712]|uniref:Uncharacterized protein n=1 Tax=Guillardia theta (strain CCMP2712) TaxID=905079 RepID=L1K1B5_GUITC|nr:hypothetical protein GUITHDRAFT_100115 [Guillardia theta CCMP2712]EKX54641.1 hypothetical protein GUITHDRAFT_100115 [Guillardia theta CCMP2712]|eukprot:XP_005841621.1 hypothetical protein GUITHDRAFT_100115 [Guillardia theta CCMP2712]